MELVNQSQNFWTKSPEVERSFECTWERTKNKAPGTANRQTECAGCPQGSSQRIALFLSYHKAGHFTRKTLSETKTFDEKERGRTMAFFTTAVTGLKTVVTAIGAGVGVWGVINLLEGYGNDNPGAKSQGIKQLMSGGGIIIVAQTVIPQLSTLFS